MATRVDAGGGFERVLPARSAADARPRGKASSWAWTVPAVGLGILFLCLEVLVHEQGTSFLSNLVIATRSVSARGMGEE